MLAAQIGLDAAIAWAFANSDPANLVLLGLVYYKLREAERSLQTTVDKMGQRIEDLHDVHTDE